jgi:hypothetical protein
MNERHRFSDLAAAVGKLEQILQSIGIEITDPKNSPFKRAEAILNVMERVHQGQAASDSTADQRENWSKAFSLGDLALKLVAANAAKPHEFKKLSGHLRYLAGDAELSLCSFTPGGHSGTPAEQQNDFIAELRIAACCVQMMDDLEFDPPSGKKKFQGKNPDIIGRFNGKKWAIECKTLHPDRPGAEQNPEAFLSRVTAARDQIKDAIKNNRADTGIVVMNMKNTVAPNAHLPIEMKDGEIYYGSHDNLPLAMANLVKGYNKLITPVSETLAEREVALAALLTSQELGGHPSIAPCVLAVYFVVDGILKDGKPTLTMLRMLQANPEPSPSDGDPMSFAQKLNSCLQDQPDHPAESPIGSRADFIKWASKAGDFTLHESQAVDPHKVPPELLDKFQEFQSSGKESLQWEETDELGNKVIKRIYKKPMPPKATP